MTVELIGVKVEKLVDQLSHSLCVAATLLRHIVLLNHLEVALKEAVSLSQAVYLLGRVFRLVVVIRSPPLALKKINGHRVIHGSLVLAIAHFLLL